MDENKKGKFFKGLLGKDKGNKESAPQQQEEIKNESVSQEEQEQKTG